MLNEVKEDPSGTNAPYSGDLAILGARRDLRNTFEEYIQQAYACAKYEHAAAKAKMMHYYADIGGEPTSGTARGQKRLLEQRKFKLLGQIQTLKSIFTSLMAANWDADQLLQGDPLYQNVYTHIRGLYQSGIDHKFLVDLLNLKNKKRESKRFVSFLEGAHRSISKIIQNEALKFDADQVGMPPIYTEAKQMIEERLRAEKYENHQRLVKLYAHQKI